MSPNEAGRLCRVLPPAPFPMWAGLRTGGKGASLGAPCVAGGDPQRRALALRPQKRPRLPF
jgi:hypothetical protein